MGRAHPEYPETHYWNRGNSEKECPDCGDTSVRPNRRCTRCAHIVEKYGVTSQVVRALFIAQQGECAACGVPLHLDGPNNRTKVQIDHDHTKDRVRALLCMGCNQAIGQLGDSPETLRFVASVLA